MRWRGGAADETVTIAVAKTLTAMSELGLETRLAKEEAEMNRWGDVVRQAGVRLD